MEIYCQYTLLERWFSNNLDLKEDPEHKDEIDRELKKLLFKSNSVVTVDVEDVSESLDNGDPIIIEFYNSFSQGKIDDIADSCSNKGRQLEEVKKGDTFVSLKSSAVIFLLNMSEKQANYLESELGVRVLGNDRSLYEHFKPLWTEAIDQCNLKTRRIKPDKDFQWEELKKLRLPFRHLCLADRYIFRNESGLKENFLPLVTALISCNPSNNIHLIVITEKLKSELSLDTIHKKIIDYFSEEFPQRTVAVTLLKAASNTPVLHDRRIITEYLTIKSGQSFNYFKNHQINLDTELDIIPHSYKTALNNSKDRVSEYKTICSNSVNSQYEKRIVGEPTFKLFE